MAKKKPTSEVLTPEQQLEELKIQRETLDETLKSISTSWKETQAKKKEVQR